MKIGFIGVGKLGMPCAEAIEAKGHEVFGFDVAKQVSNTVQIQPSIQECVEDRDIVFVAVPTPHDPDYDGKAPTSHLHPKDFNYSIVEQVLSEANKWMTKDQLLVLISTVLPGTVRRQFIELVPNTRFIYNPYLIAMGSVAWDMVNPEMIMIGTDDGTETGDAKILVDFYKTIMENEPRYVLGTWDECECIKVFYNTFISAKLGLVNMIQDVAERQGNINVDVVTEALAHSDKRIMGPQYMTAGMGDGGGCHPRDNIALRWLSQELSLGYDLFGTIMQAREIQAKNLAQYILYYAQGENLPMYIHGKAYKPGVEYIDGSYSLLIGSYIEAAGVKVNYIDPLTNDIDYPTDRCIVLLAHSASTTYKYMKEEGDDTDMLYCDIPATSIVVDPWRKFDSMQHQVLWYGNTRPDSIKLHCQV
jgi:UDPglucose 6-dehydrogenase|tara:strand:- start:593 stop:1846 length:1254 start_codon:yes stop_codon:yes gene_type:complete